jgi:aryl-phospho-beta-D-glucosidase BglC (GH1 family)
VAVSAGLASLVLLVAAVPNAAHAKAPPGFIGMNAEDVYAGSDAYQAQMFQVMQANGVTLLRQNFRWGYSEPARGVFDWTALDRFVLGAAQHGIRVLPLLYGETPWATSRPPGKEGCAYPPKKTSDFTTWVKAVVNRYGRHGSLWVAHPEAASQAMSAYEIWNEPNFSFFWKCKPNAKAYVDFARPTADAIRKLDSKALIISAGSPKIDKNPGKYFRDAFKAGAAKVFNAVGLHPYEPRSDDVLRQLQDARKALDRHGAKNWSIVVTEYGWATGGPKSNHTVNEAKQNSLIYNTLKKVAAKRKALKLRSMTYYTWRDLPPAPGQDDYWGLHTGLLRNNDTFKPGLAAMLNASHNIQ